MDAVIAWFNAWWWLVLLSVGIVMKVLNLITKHWSEHKGLVRWCLFLVELLDVVKVTKAVAAKKLLLVLLLPLGLAACSWQEAAGKSLKGAHEVGKEMSLKAEPAYRAKCGAVAKTCSGLPCAALEVCQEERRRVNSAIKALHRGVRAGTEVIPLIDAADQAAGGGS